MEKVVDQDGVVWMKQQCQQQQGPAIPLIAIGATLLSGAVAGYSAIKSSNAQSAAANYQAEVAKNNASIASSNASYAEEAGAAQEQTSALQTRAEVGSAAAAQASSGLDINSGSAVAVRSSDAALGTLSGLNIRNSAARQAYGYETQSSNFTADAGLDTATAANASAAGGISAAGSVIGSLGSAGSTYAKFNTVGVNLGGAASPVVS